MIGVIDYKAGNLTSVANALDRLGEEWEITSEPGRILRADRVIFPGVGAAPAAMKNLAELNLVEPIRHIVKRGTPFLGICLGAQILFTQSEEGNVRCLDLFDGNIVPFPMNMKAGGERLKVPQMGWNVLRIKKEHPVLAGVIKTDRFYFVHSFAIQAEDDDIVLATTDYGIDFPSVVGSNNLVACQFHPEKSGEIGLRILKNFLGWKSE